MSYINFLQLLFGTHEWNYVKSWANLAVVLFLILFTIFTNYFNMRRKVAPCSEIWIFLLTITWDSERHWASTLFIWLCFTLYGPFPFNSSRITYYCPVLFVPNFCLLFFWSCCGGIFRFWIFLEVNHKIGFPTDCLSSFDLYDSLIIFG